MSNQMVISAQPGKQEQFLSSTADVVLYGGGAGGGKTFACLLRPLYDVFDYKDFHTLFLRRTAPEIKMPGAVWDESFKIYSSYAEANQSALKWTFKTGSTIRFASMQYEHDKERYSGSQIPLIIFEEVQTFTKSQFMFMFSRNRSACGVKPQIIATCNPPEDNDHWLKDFVSWYLDADGFPVQEKSGVVRYFITKEENNETVLKWGNSKQELKEEYGQDVLPKSFTFINSTIHDNKKLIEVNPEYIANLQAMALVDRTRLLQGCWFTATTSGGYFRQEWFKFIDAHDLPKTLKAVRYWDNAATSPHENNKNPDYTVGLKLAKCTVTGYLYVMDVDRARVEPPMVYKMHRNNAEQDGVSVAIGSEKGAAESGKMAAAIIVSNLMGYDITMYRPTGKKTDRAKAFSKQVEAGNVYIVRGNWNKPYISELVAFPNGDNDDQVDASSGAMLMLTENDNVATTSNKNIRGF